MAALIVVLNLVLLAVVTFDRWYSPLTRGAIRSAFLGSGDAVFQVKPYLQPGDAPAGRGDDRESLVLLWQTADRDALWSVEVQGKPDGPWNKTEPPSERRVAVSGVSPFRLYRAVLSGLARGAGFTYRVRRAGASVFEARGSTPRPAGQAHRVAVFGDCAAGTWEQNAVAYQTYLSRPDYVMITGDVVYMRGRISEYLDRFFPVYNNDDASPGSGAPLLRSTLFYAAPGNHDLIERNLDKQPDALGFYYYWAQPLNGPTRPAGTPSLKGSEARRKAFLDVAGPAYPRMANFSFDYGDVHWTVLDTNTYVDWTNADLRGWLDADLASARNAAWRFVVFHHPPFNSSKAHADDQRLRVLAPSLEKGKVTVVFNGHVHNYQRTRPLRFVVETTAEGKDRTHGPQGQLNGHFSLDRTYDGTTHTRPDGVIYIVTGAGGARLYNVDQHDVPTSWKDYTARFVSNIHSLTLVDVTPDTLTLRQVSSTGKELDRFLITR
ncbi:MAG: hypothetical protein NVSMB9_07190 [Isosphaeraceae bacterium]